MTYCSKKRNTPWVCVHIRGHCILNKLVLLKSQFFGWVKGIKVKKEIKKKLIFLPTLAVCSPQLLLFIIANLSDFFFLVPLINFHACLIDFWFWLYHLCMVCQESTSCHLHLHTIGDLCVHTHQHRLLLLHVARGAAVIQCRGCSE